MFSLCHYLDTCLQNRNCYYWTDVDDEDIVMIVDDAADDSIDLSNQTCQHTRVTVSAFKSNVTLILATND